MQTITSLEAAADLDAVVSTVVNANEPVRLTAGDGAAVVVIPATWWRPAGDPLPDLSACDDAGT